MEEEKDGPAEEESFDEVYDDKGRDDLIENDEISSEEEAFMEGYDKGSDEDAQSGDEAGEKSAGEDEEE